MTARDDNARTQAAMQRRAAERGSYADHSKQFPDADQSPPTVREALDDLISLAEAAMRDANADGAEYDIDGELEASRAALAAPLAPTLAEWLAEARRLTDALYISGGAASHTGALLAHLDDLPARVAEYVQEQLAALTEGR